MSDLRVTNLKGRNPGEAPTLPDGVVITGITTVSSVIVGTGITLSSSGINVSGIITATSIVVSAGTTALPSISPTGDSNTGIFFPSADTIAFAEGGTEAMRVDSSGRLLIGISTSGNANGGILQLTSGITFPATAVAASDANTLDDYEEGTWTPAITFGGGNTGITYNAATAGNYTKVGRIIYVHGYLGLTAKGSSTGSVRITGLPFNVAINSESTDASFVPGYASGITHSGTLGLWAGSQGATSLRFVTYTTAGVLSDLTETGFTNTSSLMVSFWYVAA